MTILEGQSLSRTYRMGGTRVAALTNVDIRVRRGDLIALQGPSGSGKTSLMNILGLLDRPDCGSLLLDGLPVSVVDENGRADLRRDRFGFVFQTFNLVPVLSSSENVEYPMILKRWPPATRRRRAKELLQRVGLEGREAFRPDLLSGGERQRVAIARALANAPEVVFADEPTANLDSGTATRLLDLIRELNEQDSVAFVIATHDPDVVARSHRVVTLRDGRIVEAS